MTATAGPLPNAVGFRPGLYDRTKTVVKRQVGRGQGTPLHPAIWDHRRGAHLVGHPRPQPAPGAWVPEPCRTAAIRLGSFSG